MKVRLLYLTLLFSLVYLVIPDTIGAKDWFLLSDMKLHFGTHVYFIGERVGLIILSYILASVVKDDREIFTIYFLLQIGDLIDYVLFYNSIWFKFYGIPVSYNIFACVTFGAAIVWFRKDD